MSVRPGIPPEAAERPTDAAAGVANPHLAGILLFLAAIVLINLSDTSAKLTIDSVPIFQVALVQLLGLAACGMVAARSANLPRIMERWPLKSGQPVKLFPSMRRMGFDGQGHAQAIHG